MERKIKRVNNNLGIVLPLEVLERIRLKKCKDNNSILLNWQDKLNCEVYYCIDQEFSDGMKDLFNNFDETLRNLADR
ncbi:hypothetical protein JMA_03630 [Jeotgalibacillus malaysiensis]|uniref:SpoVT-AbrB domain-containing protein n=1 Tax=Jeotgalibacillus malaysiensis TaxID=1508404 RepID=A0A0B5AH27_9BACL|nr:hypothetical protein [Jeotgalibacillus malaysiensis]AJD89680.1 hypothetical protein JMA_03630 [Jeotgalibacillus malaysiensis]